MPSTLVNVRLDEGRLRKVRRLRAHGIAMSDVVREAMASRFEGVNFEMKGDAAKITVLAPARTWHDPVVVALGVLAVTTAFWLYIYPLLTPALGSVVGP